MIIFEMICTKGHRFEGWFEDHAEFVKQIKEGLIRCPVCGSKDVRQSFSTGGMLHERRWSHKETAIKKGEEAFMRALYAEIEANFENVGADFAKTALKIHYGVEPPRNIRGITSEAEEKMLREEGVEFYKIPMPPPQEEAELN
jgi:hypothetical protein